MTWDVGERTWDAIITCALRFDGYAYAELCGGGEYLHDLSARMTETFALSRDEKENLAAFFFLQRYLCKFGGDYLEPTSREHAAFRFLFLHLYRAEIEPSLRMYDWYEAWETRYAADAETYAAEVRLALRYPGGLPADSQDEA